MMYTTSWKASAAAPLPCTVHHPHHADERSGPTTHLTQMTASLTSLVLYSSASRPLALLRIWSSDRCCCSSSAAGSGSGAAAEAEAAWAWPREGCGGGRPCGRPEDCRSGGPLADGL